VMQIASGEAEEEIDDDGKDKAAQALGRARHSTAASSGPQTLHAGPPEFAG
jgi:hypothetical protein